MACKLQELPFRRSAPHQCAGRPACHGQTFNNVQFAMCPLCGPWCFSLSPRHLQLYLASWLSIWFTLACFFAQISPISSRGCMVPISLLICITETSWQHMAAGCWLGQTVGLSKSRTRAVSSRMAPSSSCHEDSHELPTCATKTVAELCQPLEYHKVLTFCVLNQLVSFRFTSPYLSTGR